MPIDAISEELFRELKALDDDRDFVVGALSYAREEDARKRLLASIRAGEDVTRERVLLMALYLSQEATSKTT